MKDTKKIFVAIAVLTLLLIGTASATVNYTSQYPPVQNATYVKATTTYSSKFYPYFATTPTTPLTGSWDNYAWASASGVYTNQRFHIDLGSAKTIRLVYYENAHSSGTVTTYGAKNYTLWGSNDASAFANLTYTNDTGWTQLTTNTTAFAQHVASDVADPHYIDVTNSVAYRYYAFKFDNAYGTTIISFRRVELKTEDETWYQFGDSITYYSYTFVMQMNATYNPLAIAKHNTDGSDQTSWWGVSNYLSHPGYPYPTKYFIMLGINDRYYNATDTGVQTADNLYAIYSGMAANGTTPYIVLEPARTSVGTLADQRDNMTLIKDHLTSHGVSYITAYDAIDLYPGNGVFDDVNTTNQPDNVHPSESAHALIAAYVWERIVPGTSAFTANKTFGGDSLAVAFTDTTNRSPTMWKWNFTDVTGNNTPITFSTSQNPVQVFGNGNFRISLSATNSRRGECQHSDHVY